MRGLVRPQPDLGGLENPKYRNFLLTTTISCGIKENVIDSMCGPGENPGWAIGP